LIKTKPIIQTGIFLKVKGGSLNNYIGMRPKPELSIADRIVWPFFLGLLVEIIMSLST
jgi:hypothetical protein